MKEQKDNVIQFRPRRKKIIIIILLCMLLFLFLILLTGFHIEKIEVTGNKHYSKEEVRRFMKKDGYIDNTILFLLKNKIRPVENIPFIAKIDVEYENPHKIKVTIYEKAVAGCVEYMNEYVYFDQDGYVLEISSTKLKDVPSIKGMSFDSMELHEKLPIKDQKRFKLILKLTQLINKYQLQIDEIKFTSDDMILLECKEIRVELGDGKNLEEQLMDLDKILKKLEGKKGVLDMKDFDSSSGNASFKEEKEEK